MSTSGLHVPADLLYSADHLWVRLEQRGPQLVLRTGLTDFAQDTLGDVQYVSLPEVGATVLAAAACGEAEASKAVSDLYAPAPGVVIAINDLVLSTPSLVNTDPYGEGWLYELEAVATPEGLLDPAGYEELIA